MAARISFLSSRSALEMKDFLFLFSVFLFLHASSVLGVFVKDEEPSTKRPVQVEELPWMTFFDRKSVSDNTDRGKFQRISDLASHSTLCPPGETGQFPYPPDCKRFINCWKGRGSIQVCAPGTLFNAETFECDFPGKVKCEDGFGGFGDAVPAATGARYMRFPHERPAIAHNQRIARRNQNEESKPDSIPAKPQPGRPPYFGPSHLLPPTRRPGSQSQGREVRPQCPLGATGLYPHPYDCSKFLKCWSGNTFIQNCGPGTFFNPLISACDHPRNVPCAHEDDPKPDESEITAEDVQVPEESVQYEQYQDVNLGVKGGKKTIKQDPSSPTYDQIESSTGKNEAEDMESGTIKSHRKPKVINTGSNQKNQFTSAHGRPPASYLTPPQYDVYGNVITSDNVNQGVQPGQAGYHNSKSPKVQSQSPSYPSDPFLINYPPQGPYSTPQPGDQHKPTKNYYGYMLNPKHPHHPVHPHHHNPNHPHHKHPHHPHAIPTYLVPPPFHPQPFPHYAPYHPFFSKPQTPMHVMHIPYYPTYIPDGKFCSQSEDSNQGGPSAPKCEPGISYGPTGSGAKPSSLGSSKPNFVPGYGSYGHPGGTIQVSNIPGGYQPDKSNPQSSSSSQGGSFVPGFASSGYPGGTIQVSNIPGGYQPDKSNPQPSSSSQGGSFVPGFGTSGYPGGTIQVSNIPGGYQPDKSNPQSGFTGQNANSHPSIYQPSAPSGTQGSEFTPLIQFGASSNGFTGQTTYPNTYKPSAPSSGSQSGSTHDSQLPSRPYQSTGGTTQPENPNLNYPYYSQTQVTQPKQQESSNQNPHHSSGSVYTGSGFPPASKGTDQSPQYQPYLFYYYPMNSNLYPYYPGYYYPNQNNNPQTPPNSPQKPDSSLGQAPVPDPFLNPEKPVSPQYKPSAPVYVSLNTGSSQPASQGQVQVPDPFQNKNYDRHPESHHSNVQNESYQKTPVYVPKDHEHHSNAVVTEPEPKDTSTFPPFPGNTHDSVKTGIKSKSDPPKQYLLGQIDVRTGAEDESLEDAESIPTTQQPPRKRGGEKVDETFVKENTKKPLYKHPDKYSQPEKPSKENQKPDWSLEEPTTKKTIKPETDFDVGSKREEQNRKNQTKKPFVKVKQTPPNGQVVRLRNGASHLDGYLEMKDKNAKWGLICDHSGQWGIAEATVACRELGFIRGAELSWQGYPIKSESEDLHVAVNGITCKGTETSLSECEVSSNDSNKCDVGRNAVGLRCFDNLASHCQPGEILYNQHCYRLHEKENPDDPWIRTEEASEQCKKHGGKLVDITSQYENDFLSEWLIKKHPDVTAVATGGIGISVLGRPMWLWEGTSDPMVYERWWSGWSGDQDIPKGSIDGPLCIVLRKTFSCSDDDDDGQKVAESTKDEDTCSADYFFWDVEDCGKLRTSVFICERPMDDIGCVVGNGEAYVGTANTTASGQPCLPWDHPKAVEGLARRGSVQERSSRLVGHNFCRNLGNPDRHPWCFVEGKGNSEYCAIPQCWDSVSGSYSRSSGSWSSCDVSHFECKPGECVKKEWVCDGQKDCTNGRDEEGCRVFLQEFKTERNKRLNLKGNERWPNVNENICAKLCLENKNFKCRSFSYNFKDKDCLLSEANIGLSGQVVAASGWAYHERTSESVKCTLENGFFGCANGKCVNVSNVCDGKRNCEDGSDEKNCGRLGYQIRLAGGEDKHRGRVEVKILGKWGVVCDDMFDMRDAEVVCRELGFKLGAAEVLKHSEFPVENPLFLVDRLDCLGNETTIRECPFPGWGKHNCGPEEVVGVSCRVPGVECPDGQWQCKKSKECISLAYVCDELKDCDDGTDEDKPMCESPTQIRLAGGPNATSGRLEIRRYGIWGTVCHDDFSSEAGGSVCSLLGFNGHSLVKKSAHFGAGKGPIWLDSGLCFINETNLEECTKQIGFQNNCNHDEDVSVICSEEKSQEKSSGIKPIIASSADSNSIKAEEKLRQVLISECSGKLKPKSRILHHQQEKVIGGSAVTREALPWQASVRVKSGTGKTSHWCGAVVISPYHVLTAGHCLRDYDKAAYIIRVGDYDTKVRDPHEREFGIEQLFMHPEFSKTINLNNDIGLVKIKGEIPLGDHIKPACLAPSLDVYRPGTNCSVSGWGSASAELAGFARTLRRAFIPILEPSVCRAPYVYGDSLSEGMFCVGHLDGGVDSCQGDSGGPLMCQHNGREYLFGITSWGFGCGRANKPGVYTNVAFYAEWIQQKIESSLS